MGVSPREQGGAIGVPAVEMEGFTEKQRAGKAFQTEDVGQQKQGGVCPEEAELALCTTGPGLPGGRKDLGSKMQLGSGSVSP